MKKLIYLAIALFALASCESTGSAGSGGIKNVDYQMFSDEKALTEVYNMILEKLGTNVTKMDKLDISMDRPSKEGNIIKEGAPDRIYIMVDYLYPENDKKIFDLRYDSSSGGWDKGTAKSVQLISGDAENFVLADEMFDMSQLKAEMIVKIVKDALAKYKDDSKYSMQYVKNIIITEDKVEIGIYGILSANDMEKKNYYKADFNGRPI